MKEEEEAEEERQGCFRVDGSCSLSNGLGSRRIKVPSGLARIWLHLQAVIKNVANNKRKTAEHKCHQCRASGNECSTIPAHCSVALTWEDVIGRPGCPTVCAEPARFYNRFDFFFFLLRRKSDQIF